MIISRAPHDVSSMQMMQMDSWDGGASHLVPALLAIPDSGNPDVATMQKWLRVWQGGSEEYQATGPSASAAVYQATWRHVLANTFHDELPEERWPTGGGRWFEVVRNLLLDPTNPWWDNVTTSGQETMENILFKSMGDAHHELVDLLGDDPGQWAWGDLHIARFENQTLGQSGIGPVEWLFNRTAPPVLGGGSSIVNAIGWDADKSYLVDWVPSMRMVVDLSDLTNSSYVHTTGNSGHAFHEHYTNMIEPWAEGVQAPMYWKEEDVRSVATSTLSLVPGDS
jgi:penicillin amidase